MTSALQVAGWLSEIEFDSLLQRLGAEPGCGPIKFSRRQVSDTYTTQKPEAACFIR